MRLASARWALHGLLLTIVALSGCAPSGPTGTTAPAPAPGGEPRTLIALVGLEPSSIAARALVSAGTSLRFQQRLPNASLTVIDAQGLPQPELLVSLPTLNTESWRVFPDGTMQTSYTLRPNLTWHDGQPLTSDDFVFGWRVYSSPDLGLANQPPMAFIADVSAVDRQRFVINWKQSYPDANSLSYYNRELPALPEHILGTAFDRMGGAGRESFVSNPYWTQEYVGLGFLPHPAVAFGAYIDFVRFEGYALGAPKIERIEMRFNADPNVAVASLLSGAVHVAPSLDNTEAIKPEWARTSAGRFLNTVSSWNYIAFQMRPEYANPSAPLDRRVRKAIAHLVDREALIDTIFGGRGILTDTPIWTGSQWGPAIDSSITSYPLDPRATDAFMNQAGFTRGVDGFYRGAEGRLPLLEVLSTGSADKVQMSAVIGDWLKVAGFDTQQMTIPAAQAQDNQLRSVFPGVLVVSSNSGDAALNLLSSASIPSANNRWVGINRGGWSSPDYDRFLNAFSTSLDRGERVGVLRQMLRLYSEEVPLVSIAFSVGDDAVVAAVKGPATVAPESNMAWNIHAWELQ